MSKDPEYAILIRPLPAKDGGGWLAEVPDLPGCMADGESRKEALENALDAIESWKEAAEELGRRVPAPETSAGQWRQRVPRTLHFTLKKIAETEGVSLNQLVTAILAESIGRRFGSGNSSSSSP
jgi:antitoxin HicB